MLPGKLDQTMDNVIMENEPKKCIMLSRKPNKTMHNVIRKFKPNHGYCYQGNQTKKCIMLST